MYQCLNPLVAKLKFNKRTGKNELSGFFNLRKQFENVGNQYLNDWKYYLKHFREDFDEEVVVLPCRKCVNCQRERSLMWSIRNQFEAEQYDCEQCLFITLTYNDDNVVNNKLFKNEDVNNNIFSLKKTDLQKFIKDLRNCFNDIKIRYFACGEYGGITLRPHYHILLYGLGLSDIKSKFYKGQNYAFEKKYDTENGSVYYSELLEEVIWKKGFVEVALFSEKTANYVSRYCTKKFSVLKKENYHIDKNMLQDTFNIMSLKPAIGLGFYEKYKDKMYKDDEFLFHYNGKTIFLRPFDIYDRHFDIERPEEYKFVKENRKAFAKLFNYFTNLETNINISEYLRNLENSTYEKIKRKEVI